MNDQLTPAAKTYLQQVRNPLKLRLYFLKNLPSALWWGIGVRQLTVERSEITLPYSWRTKNPFRSIYFAAQVGAGEMATGILANLARFGRGRISMLVVDQQATFTKKANTLTTFTCEDGALALATVQRAIDTREPQTITMIAIGRNAEGTVVSEVRITWSFKAG
jgi:hypothetical protein